ncbi:nucleotidyltransferase family protein [Serpentinicella alkaliphila]|uniref:Nucleotidyltransferase-like protein n=1 Tax=Serpentinicella alkaliphila TaxID=1734049 RepID=A0A4R2TVU4_9FIRM|nr:nucleotidyltransferase domain-containing protein [Serpentinicella alkaliphila]QUH26887.1 nucleotidyltransferase domain-containing protein [Serpentinicella alkaliphila]TCQ08120.1 nucleotidyltransferase-like protein [Serpentinicella alkaliphila]
MEKESLLQKLDEFLVQVNLQYPIEFAYLFGSFAIEKNNNESDVDIAIMFQENMNLRRKL